jgi:hypothetical protein
MVRRHRMNKKGLMTTTTKFRLPCSQKSHYDLGRRSYAYPKVFPQSASNSASIDVWYRYSNGWEQVERTKGDGDITNKCTHLIPKIALRNELPEIRRFQSIAAMPFECHVDWCLIQVKKWVRTVRKYKKWSTITNNSSHLLAKNHLTERVAASAPIQSYPYNLHRIRNRLMYRTYMKKWSDHDENEQNGDTSTVKTTHHFWP